MRVKIITLSFSPSLGGFDDRPLAEFVRDKEILAVREHFFVVHDLPHVACLLTYQDPGPTAAARATNGAAPRAREPRSDPPFADLDPRERVLFGELREWRFARARKDGVPPYVVFTNRELLAIVRARPATPSALAALPGIGAKKVERYGREILARFQTTPPNGPTPPPETTS